jgi:cytochrome c peroxidase
MKKISFVLLTALFTFLTGCNNNETKQQPKENELQQKNKKDFSAIFEQAKTLFAVLPDEAKNPDNPITAEKVALGKALYFDKRLSKDNTQSCNTCHNLNTYGVDNQPFSKGNNGGFGGRNSPTTLNAAFHIAQFWDGREKDVEAQAGGPILNPVEMEMPNEKAVVDRLSKIKEYPGLFQKAFPGEKNPISFDNVKKAIGAFERKLVTPSKFDKYLAGDNNALNDQEKQGLETYIKVGCATCHSGAVLGGNMFQKFGIYGDYWNETKSKKIDNGRFDVTKNEADKYVFKVPSLRNIEKTYPYFHDGSVSDLKTAVKIMAQLELNKKLDDKQVDEIVTFLKTLTGEVDPALKQ